MEDLEINLEVNNDCQTDEVTPTSTIDDDDYLIAVDGVISLVPTWDTSVPGCPVTYEIGRIVNGVEQPLTQEELNVINFSAQDGQMAYNTNDFKLD